MPEEDDDNAEDGGRNFASQASEDECKPFLPMMPMTAASRIHAADAASTLLESSAAAAAAAAL
jgi:hypothetical protein